MWKRLLVVTAVSAAMSSMALAAPLTVGFSQVGSESGWRAAETSVAKSEAQKRGITLKVADGQQKQEQKDPKADKDGGVDDFFHPQYNNFCFRAHRKPPDFVYYSVFGSIGIYDRE